MSGIAYVFRRQGYTVSGSDIGNSDTIESLAKSGIKIFPKHNSENIDGATVVVTSTAIGKDNPEVTEAKARKIPVVPRAEILGELMRGKIGIAVAGTHGKTSTTTMLGLVLGNAKMDPTVIVGGKVDALEGSARLGTGDIVVAEADESDSSFLNLPMTYSIITNIDLDHLDHFQNQDNLDNVFQAFVSKLPFYGKSIVCGDDEGVRRNILKFTKPVLTYGVGKDNDYCAYDLNRSGWKTQFKVKKHDIELGNFVVNLPGDHVVMNALSVIALCDEIGLESDKIESGIELYRGVRRRFEVIFEDSPGGRILIDDYAHHPTEIKATLRAAKAICGDKKLKVVFQPHRFTRTRDCFDQFAGSFSDADCIAITEVYPAGEVLIPGYTSIDLVDNLKKNLPEKDVRFLQESQLNSGLKFENNTVLLFLGAGTISKLARIYVDAL